MIENIKKKDGRYIVFLPYNKDPNLSSEEYMRQEIEKVKEFFRDIDPNPEIEYLLSDRADKKENLKALKRIDLCGVKIFLKVSINLFTLIPPQNYGKSGALAHFTLNADICFNNINNTLYKSKTQAVTLN